MEPYYYKTIFNIKDERKKIETDVYTDQCSDIKRNNHQKKESCILKSVILIALLLYFSASVKAQLDVVIEDIIVEATPVKAAIAAANPKLPADAVCYRIFVDMMPDAGFSVVTGTSASVYRSEYPLSIETTTKFFNSTFGSTKGDLILEALIVVDSSLLYDSFISSGGITDSRVGVPYTLDEKGYITSTPVQTNTTPGLNLSMFGTDTSSVDFYTVNGSWGGLVAGGVKGPDETDSTIVLIGQFTTNGQLRFKLNINVVQTIGQQTKILEHTATGKWFNDDISQPIIQYTPLQNVYGPGINHPSVSIPYDDTIALRNQPFILKALASDADGTIDSVEFRINNIVVGVDKTAPYEMDYTLLNSSVFSAVAIDDDGAVTQSSRVRLIALDSVINLDPEINIESPLNNTVYEVGSTIAVAIETSDIDGYIDSVLLKVNNVVVAVADTVINDTITLNWLSGNNGNFKLTATSIDNTGAETSDSVYVIIGEPPSVSITSPSATTSLVVGKTVLITADASDGDGSIQRVEFFADQVSLGTDNSSPYQINWTPATTGQHIIRATATDNDGLSGSATRTVNAVISAIEEIHGNNYDLKIYPNPAEDHITIELTSEMQMKSGQIILYNILGDAVYNSNLVAGVNKQQILIDMSEFTSGMYILRVYAENAVFNEVIIKK